jgi:hypothetical protein
MKPESLTTKDVAEQFNITGKQLRRILRSFERYDDGKYTRYQLGKRDVEQVAKHLAPAKPAPKKVKKEKVQTPPPAETIENATA